MTSTSDRPFLESSAPPWAARALAWVLLALFAASALALVLVQIPETVVAPFVLVAERGADPVRTLHDGIVTAVRVADAQTVEAGTILFAIRSELVGDRRAERAALGASLAGGEARLANEQQKYENERHADDQEVGRLQQRLAAFATQAALKERQVEIAREVAARQQLSYEQGLTSWIESSKSHLEAERLGAELEAMRAEAAEARTAAARQRFSMASHEAAFHETARSVREELERTRARKAMLDAESSRDDSALPITAPCSGTIVRLVVRNVGSVVRASDVLAEITCREERLQAELTVSQRGLALMRAGQVVKLRYDAFPYQRFGVRHGTLRWISPSATWRSADGSVRAIADLDEQTLRIAGDPRALLPGMSGQAAIVVGRRTLASFAIEPLRAIGEAVSTGRPGGSGR